MEEIWKEIKGFEGMYEVSNHGRVRSLDRFLKIKFGNFALRKGKILSPGIGNSGYYFVNICKEQKDTHWDIHRIEALTFYGYENAHLTVNHKDGNKLNNILSNLEFMTQSENNRHKREVLGKTNVGDRNGSNNGMFGKKHSYETRKKISLKALERWKK